MGYADQRYWTLKEVSGGFGVSFGTATASSATGHNLSDVAASLPKFQKRTDVLGVRLRVTVIPNAASTNLVAQFMNGTNTLGTAVLTTATADQFVDFTITNAANGTFADDAQPTINLTGTATASAAANGSYDIWMEVKELPS